MRDEVCRPGIAARLLLLGWIACVGLVTLYPFEFVPAAGREASSSVDPGLSTAGATDAALNVLLFVPIGALFSHLGVRHSCGLSTKLATAAATALALSVPIEWLQGYLPTRHRSIIDVVSNSLGSVVGVAVQYQWVHHGRRLRQFLPPAVVTGALVAYAGVALTASAALQLGSRLDTWDPSYPLLIGNEATGTRPWRGRVLFLRVTDSATSQKALEQFAAGSEIAVPGRLLASADRIQNPSLASASDLVRRISRTSEFTLLTRCATEDVRQRGPARIISNSKDEAHRNFTLAQAYSALVVRLRTRISGPNGTNPEMVLDDVFTDSRPRDLIVTYDGAVLSVAVAGSGRIHMVHLGPGAILAGLYDMIRAGDVEAHRVGYCAALFAIPAILIGAFTHSGRWRLAISVVWVLAFATALETTLSAAATRQFDAANLWRDVTVGSMAMVLVGGTASTVSAVHREQTRPIVPN